MRVIIRCREANELMSRHLDGELQTYEVLQLKLHTLMCAWCRKIQHHFSIMSRAIKRLGQP